MIRSFGPTTDSQGTHDGHLRFELKIRYRQQRERRNERRNGNLETNPMLSTCNNYSRKRQNKSDVCGKIISIERILMIELEEIWFQTRCAGFSLSINKWVCLLAVFF